MRSALSCEGHHSRRANRAPGRCRAGGGLLGGKDPTGPLSMPRHGFPAAATCLLPCNDHASAITEVPEHIVVARGSVIGKDERPRVGARHPTRREVEAAAL